MKDYGDMEAWRQIRPELEAICERIKHARKLVDEASQ